jgi:hypothetical protein
VVLGRVNGSQLKVCLFLLLLLLLLVLLLQRAYCFLAVAGDVHNLW